MKLRQAIAAAAMLTMFSISLASSSNTDPADLKAITSYRSWLKVNPSPIVVAVDFQSLGG
ncbi:MAG TPA: hypothetical protein VGN86_10710 [Pyrinomonadaceae bacterium]|jgi:hypothetical protein|nr:hypothetical protein [Pyrinomonadaceae bacterium]